MSASVIKEFLISLGFKTDETSQRKFVDGVTNATSMVNTLGKAVEALAVGGAAYAAYKWLDNMTGGLEKMYYAATRTGSSVRDLQSFGYAASQMGSSFEQAVAAAQNLHQFMINTPNAEAWLRNNLGINTRGADGQQLSGEALLQEIGKSTKYQQMPGYMQAKYAEMLGIPLELRSALLHPEAFQGFETSNNREMRQMGLDPDKAGLKAVKFQAQLGQLGQTFHNLGMSITSSLVGDHGGGGALDRFKTMLVQHVPQITAMITKLADAAIPLISRLLDALSAVNWDKVFGIIEKIVDGLVLMSGGKLPDDGTRHDSPAEVMMAKGIDMVRGFWDPEARQRVSGNAPVNHSADYHPDRMNWSAATAGTGGSGPQAMMRALEAKLGLPAGLLDSVWATESARGKHMRSGAGAMGHFQFMPQTAKLYGVSDPNNLEQSAGGAAHLFANLLKKYKGNLEMALAAYNWGDKNLDEKGIGRAPKETRDYIKRVEGMMRNPYGAGRPGKAGGNGDAKDAAGTTLNASTTINVNGAGDPQSTAVAVANKQADANQRLVRNFRQVWA